MALGKPTVSFDTHENRVTAEEAALYADNNSVEHFAELTERLMDDADLRATMGAIGRERVEKSLAWKHQRENLVAMYNGLFGRTAEQSADAACLSFAMGKRTTN